MFYMNYINFRAIISESIQNQLLIKIAKLARYWNQYRIEGTLVHTDLIYIDFTVVIRSYR